MGQNTKVKISNEKISDILYVVKDLEWKSSGEYNLMSPILVEKFRFHIHRYKHYRYKFLNKFFSPFEGYLLILEIKGENVRSENKRTHVHNSQVVKYFHDNNKDYYKFDDYLNDVFEINESTKNNNADIMEMLKAIFTEVIKKEDINKINLAIKNSEEEQEEKLEREKKVEDALVEITKLLTK